MFVGLLVLTLQGGWIAEIVWNPSDPKIYKQIKQCPLAVKRSRSFQLGALCSYHLAQLVMEISSWTIYECECITFQEFFWRALPFQSIVYGLFPSWTYEWAIIVWICKTLCGACQVCLSWWLKSQNISSLMHLLGAKTHCVVFFHFRTILFDHPDGLTRWLTFS